MIDLKRGTWGERGCWHGAVGIVDPWKGEPEPLLKRIAIMCCPACGKDCSLADHTVGVDGMITPSVVCPTKVDPPSIGVLCSCGFHDHVKLIGWAEWKEELLAKDESYWTLGVL